MKIKIAFLIIIIFISINCFSQKFSLGLENGLFFKPILSISNSNNYIKSNEWWGPTNLKLVFYKNFDNNIFIKTGLGYYYYLPETRGLIKLNDPVFSLGSVTQYRYHAFTIPALLGYKLQVFPNFFIKYSSGINFDIYFGYRGESGFLTEEIIQEREEQFQINKIDYSFYSSSANYKTNFNFLLSQQLAFSYETKKSIYIDIFAEYSAGLIKTIEGTGQIRILEDNHIRYINPVITSYGSYWRFGFAVGYIFKDKNKDKKRQ